MATKFQIKRTSVSGRTPNTTNSANSSYIAAGELALNLTDKKMYSSNGTNYFEIGSFKVELVNSTSNVSTFTEISTLQFDEDSGFDVTNPSSGIAKVAINSTFKFWQVDGVQKLTAAGLDTVNFIGGNNISITANGANTPQSIAFATSMTPTFTSVTFGNSTVNTTINSSAIAVSKIFANGVVGTAGKVLTANGTGGIYWGDSTSGGGGGDLTIISDTFSGNGSNTVFTLSVSTVTDKTFVYLNGVLQTPTTDYSVANTTLTFVTAPPSDNAIEVRTFDIPSVADLTVTSDNFTGNGSNTQFTLTTSLSSDQTSLVFLNGVAQVPTTDYSISGSTLTFTAAPANGTNIQVTSFTAEDISTTTYTGNGSNTEFTLGTTSTTSKTVVTLNGVTQTPVTDYSVSGATLVFAVAPANNDKIVARSIPSTASSTAGGNTHIQYNKSGSLGGSAGFTFNETTNNVTIANTLTVPNLRINASNPPANSTSTGATGTIAWDSGYIYVAVGTNTWKKIAISETGAAGGGGGSGLVRDSFTGNGSNVNFTLSKEPANEAQTLVFVDRVLQRDADYSLSGTTLTFASAPDNSAEIDVYISDPATTEAAGANTNIIFNDSNFANGSAAFTFNKATNTVALSNTLTVGSNLTINTSAIFIGNSTVNTTIIAGNVDLQGTQLRVGNVVVNGNQLTLGNVTITDTQITVGNSTVNTVLGSTGSLSGNGSQLTSVNAIALQGNSVNDILLAANTAANTLASAAFSNAATRADNAYSNATTYASNADNISSGTLNTARLPATVNVSTTINVGANVNINTSTIFIGNSTVNTTIAAGNINLQGTQLTVGNVTVTGDSYTIGNSTVNTTISGGSITINGVNVNTAITSNAATAYSNATSYADTKAGQAFTNAASRADSAYSNAVAYAASNSYVNTTFLPFTGGTLTGNLTVNATANIVSNLSANNVTFRGDVQIDGNLTVSGTSVVINATSLAVEDNMIYLNNGSQVSHPDLGFAGNYNDGSYKHAGFFRDATDGVWKLFDGYTPEPDASAYIDTSNASFRIADFTANAITGNTFTGNGAALTSINATSISSGTLDTARLPATANITTAINVGANVNVNTSVIQIGNSTVNTSISAATILINGVNVNTAITSNAATAYSNAIAYSGNAALAYSNATSFASNATNISSGTIGFARLPALYLGTTQIQSSSAAQAVSGITTLAAGNTTITGFANVTSTITSRIQNGYAFIASSDSNTAYTGFVLKQTNDAGFLGVSGSAGHWTDQSVQGDISLRSETNLLFAAGGSSARMYLASNGNVGIGTTTPGRKLDILNSTSDARVVLIRRGTQDSDASLPTSFGNPYLQIGGIEYKTNSLQSIGFGWQQNASGSNPPGEIGFVTTSTASYTLGDLVFGTRSVTTDTAVTERVRISSNGNVGVGTSTPINKLQVVGGTIGVSDGAATNRGRFFWTTSGFTGIGLYNDDNSSLVFGTNATARVEIDVSGNMLPYANATYNLGSTTKRWSTVYTSDLDLSNGIGDWTIVEGEDDLFIYNNKRGKVYKFNLTEVDPASAVPKKENQ